MNIEIFVSHSDKDKKDLIGLREKFIRHNIKFFLAHADIESGSNYIRSIKDKLKSCDVFLLYSTSASKKSFFCNQEIGWALALKKPFIILGNRDTRDFHWGLMPTQQSCGVLHVPFNEDNTNEIFNKILNNLTNMNILGENQGKNITYLNTLKNKGYDGFHMYIPEKIIYNYSYQDICNFYLKDNKINLIPDAWNDNGFNTTFSLCYGREINGEIKICHKNQGNGKSTYTKNIIDENFMWLSNDFLSYSEISIENELDYAVHFLLRNCKLNKNFARGFMASSVVKSSLFRGNNSGFEDMFSTAN